MTFAQRCPDAGVSGTALDHPGWSSLTTGHAHLAEVRGRARRYPQDVSLFAAVDGFDDEAWADLAALVGPGGRCILMQDAVPTAPAGWVEHLRGPGHQMVVGPDGLAEVEPVATRPLTADDVPAMLELVALTEPGPFQPRTIEMGRYVGHFDGARLLAMAGERMRPEGCTEISAVCTHPDARGRGLASSLTRLVADGISGRGERPVLHVGDYNTNARRAYERLGFVARLQIDYVFLQPPG